eukprot:scaffold3905_cov122-Isochrysis_galbana.AAC.2
MSRAEKKRALPNFSIQSLTRGSAHVWLDFGPGRWSTTVLRPQVSESALSEGTPPVGPWRGVCVSACDIPGALRSRPLVW